MPPPTPSRSATLACALACSLLVSACETGFEPFHNSDIHYSIYGYLDAGADTQFVRVSPLRDKLQTDPAPIDAAVSLEHVATGRRWAWQDSLFHFDDGRVAHNFWSTEELLPGETYRFTVERSDGARSTATVTMPPVAPPPTFLTGLEGVFGPPPPFSHSIDLPGVVKVADLRIVYHTNDGPHTISYTTRVKPTSKGWAVGFNAINDLRSNTNPDFCPDVTAVEVFLATAGADWPDLAGLDPETLALLGTTKNVQNGAGFLGGVTVSRFDWGALVGAIQVDKRMKC